jgi:hypothetical protein
MTVSNRKEGQPSFFMVGNGYGNGYGYGYGDGYGDGSGDGYGLKVDGEL